MDSLWYLANKNSAVANHKEVTRLFLAIDAIAQKTNNIDYHISALTYLAFSQFKQKNYQQALEQLDRINQTLKDLAVSVDAVLYTDVFYIYGLIYKDLGNYKAALYFFEKTLESPNFAGFTFRTDDLYENTARIYRIFGDYKKADRYYKQAFLELENSQEVISNKDRSLRYNNIARNYEAWGKLTLAHQYYQLALEQLDLNSKKESEQNMLLIIYGNLATYFTNLNKVDSAYYYLKKIQQFSLNKYRSMVYAKKIGIVEQQERKFEEAINHFKKAVQLSLELQAEKHPQKSELYNNIGKTYVLQEKHHLALPYFQQALINAAWDFNDTLIANNPSLKNINSPSELFTTLQLKAASLAAIGSLSASLETYQLATQLLELQCTHYLATDESRFFWVEKAKPLYQAAIEVALKLDQKAVAFEYIQRGHGLLLLQNIQHTEALSKANLSDSLRKQVFYYKMLISSLESKLLASKKQDNQVAVKRQESQLLLVEQEQKRFVNYLKTTYPIYAQQINLPPPVSIEEVRDQLLTDENALIEYFLAERTLYTLVLTKDHLNIYKAPIIPDFTEKIKIFKNLLNHYHYNLEDYTRYCRVGYELYEILLKRAAASLPNTIQELVIIPDEHINYIPFAALLYNPVDVSKPVVNYSELPYILNKYSVSYNYASALFQYAANSNGKNELVGFAPSFGGSYSANRNLDSLIYNMEEVHLIDSIVGGQMYVSKEATLETFKESITHSTIVHLATHASCNDSLPMDSYIYFYNDSLPIHEIPNLRQTLQLAVLSACETSKGVLRKGEGIISLARAFIQSGCPSVVTSLWKVNDPQTPLLMKHFYLQLKAGAATNIALSEAQRTYITEEALGDSFTHPYYWATFIQVGDTAPVIVNKSYFKLSLFVLFLVLLLIALILRFS